MDNINAVQQSLSFYVANNTSTHELAQAKNWLLSIKADCEFKIDQIKKIESDRKRAEKWRTNINAISKEFRDSDNLHIDLRTRLDIVRQHLGHEHPQARAIALQAHKWAQKQVIIERNQIICLKKKSGESVTVLARDYGLSRQQVYNVIKDDKTMQLLKGHR